MKRINIIILSIFIFGIFSCQDSSNPLLTEDDPQNLDKLVTYQEVSIQDEFLTPFVPILPSGYASGMIAAGTGMEVQPGQINITIPENVNIEKVFVYWEGRTETLGKDDIPDNTIEIGGYSVEGTLIGQSAGNGFVFRADISKYSIDYSSPISVNELDGFSKRADGAAIVVIYSNETTAFLDIRDGADFAFLCSRLEAVPQIFTFEPTDMSRNAELWMIVGDAESESRPDEIIVTVDGTPTSYKDQLVGISGPQLDVLKIDLEIPAGATEVKVELISGPDGVCDDYRDTSPESLLWILGGLSIELPTYSQGTFTQGYWKNHPEEWPVTSLDLGNITYEKEQLLSILKTPVKGNGLVSLAHQLIAAKLNVANGADPSSISNTIDDADLLIGDSEIPPVGKDKLKPKETSSLIKILDSYNNGLIGPGHCD